MRRVEFHIQIHIIEKSIIGLPLASNGAEESDDASIDQVAKAADGPTTG